MGKTPFDVRSPSVCAGFRPARAARRSYPFEHLHGWAARTDDGRAELGSGMRLYFHLRAPHDSIPDLEGVEVDDVEQAKAAALEMLAELRQENPSAARDWSGWTLDATDAACRVLFSLDLSSGA